MILAKKIGAQILNNDVQGANTMEHKYKNI